MKIGLITGASRGLGRSMALHLAQKGYHIIFTYNNSKEKADEVIQEIKFHGQEAIALQLDTTKVDSFELFITQLKNEIQTKWQCQNIDLLVNNAGIGINASIANTTVEELDQLYNVHVKGPYFLTQKLLPFIKDGGTIINISTGLTRFCLTGFSAYAMMKGAVEVMTKYLAQELGNHNITVNTIAPGAIETDFGNGTVRDNKQVNNFISSQTALGRAGYADDIGAALANLVSEECHWINAQRIEISGGMFL